MSPLECYEGVLRCWGRADPRWAVACRAGHSCVAAAMSELTLAEGTAAGATDGLALRSRLERFEYTQLMRERAALPARACVALHEQRRHRPRAARQAWQRHVQSAAMDAPSKGRSPRGSGCLAAPHAWHPSRVLLLVGTQVDTRLSASSCAVACASERGAPRPLPVARLDMWVTHTGGHIPAARQVPLRAPILRTPASLASLRWP